MLYLRPSGWGLSRASKWLIDISSPARVRLLSSMSDSKGITTHTMESPHTPVGSTPAQTDASVSTTTHNTMKRLLQDVTATPTKYRMIHRTASTTEQHTREPTLVKDLPLQTTTQPLTIGHSTEHTSDQSVAKQSTTELSAREQSRVGECTTEQSPAEQSTTELFIVKQSPAEESSSGLSIDSGNNSSQVVDGRSEVLSSPLLSQISDGKICTENSSTNISTSENYELLHLNTPVHIKNSTSNEAENLTDGTASKHNFDERSQNSNTKIIENVNNEVNSIENSSEAMQEKNVINYKDDMASYIRKSPVIGMHYAVKVALDAADEITKELLLDSTTAKGYIEATHGDAAILVLDPNKVVTEQKIKKKMFALLLSYCGKGFYGMQLNPPQITIEGELLRALQENGLVTEAETRRVQSVNYQRAARTDKGVSAARQVVSLRMSIKDGEEMVYLKKLNDTLPAQIRVMDIRRVTKNFNSKNWCDNRTYSYLTPTFAFAPIEKVSNVEYRITDEELQRLRRLFTTYEGTHNFHNFTSKKKATDASANRFIISTKVEDPFVREGAEWLHIKIKGQSFMMHQIRKMVGLVVAICRGLTAPSVLLEALSRDKVDTPKAPGLGLVLEEPHYDVYNAKFGTDGYHQVLEWSHLSDKLEKFRMDFIDSDIVTTELSEHCMLDWLEQLYHHTYKPDYDNVIRRYFTGVGRASNQLYDQSLAATTDGDAVATGAATAVTVAAAAGETATTTAGAGETATTTAGAEETVSTAGAVETVSTAGAEKTATTAAVAEIVTEETAAQLSGAETADGAGEPILVEATDKHTEHVPKH